MQQPLLAALVVALGLAAVRVPAAATTVVVGYITPGVQSGVVDVSDPPLAAPEIRAQAVVVNSLEPGRSDVATRHRCPETGCRYALIVVDPLAVRDDEGRSDDNGGVGCNTLDYGVVDQAPDERSVGGARLYTGTGAIPAETAAGGGRARRPLLPGVGVLCFANPAHEDGLYNDARDGPLVSTQPVPVVIFYGPNART